MDYSFWRRQLDNSLAAKNGMSMNTVTVKKLRTGSQNVVHNIEEAKNEDANSSADYLLNYTFDLSLDDHMRTGSGNNDDYFIKAGENVLDELNETQDQVDNLLEELNELVNIN